MAGPTALIRENCPLATEANDGLMSRQDKTTLNNLVTGGTLRSVYNNGSSDTDQTMTIAPGKGGPITLVGDALIDIKNTLATLISEIATSGNLTSWYDKITNATGIDFDGVTAHLYGGDAYLGLFGAPDFTPAWFLGWAFSPGATIQGTLTDLAMDSPTFVKLRTLVADGATAVAAIVDTANVLSNASARLQSFRNSAVEKFAIMANGIPRWSNAANAQATVGAGGAASPPPATPQTYLKVQDSAGNTYVIPAYLAS